MLQLLNPIWLFGIAGILIPLIIHLWNVKTGKTIKVGSITLIGESSRQNSYSLKLMELLLLFLRCLLIILLSVLLAGPVWKNLQTTKENNAWILIEKSAFSETYKNFKSEIDSLLNAGNELRFFEPGFNEAELEEMLEDTTKADTSTKLSYWSLIRLMEQQIPRGSKAFIFTSDRANRFTGTRPGTTTTISWKTFTPADSTSKWIDQAFLTSSGNIRTLVSESNPQETFSRVIDINPGDEISGIRASINNGNPQVQLNKQNVVADTSTLTIAINAEGFPNDAEYISAAINAIQKYTSRKIKLVKPSSQQDILLWLSAKALPSGIKAGSMVFQYAQGKAISVNSWLKISEGQAPTQTETISLNKRISYPEKAIAFPIWEDGFGNPLLDLNITNDISLYTFYSRLNPEWTDLVWSPEFVKFLMSLILPDEPDRLRGVYDKRSFPHSQLLPSSVLRPQTSKNLLVNTRNLQHHLWLVLMILFFTERYLSFRNSIT